MNTQNKEKVQESMAVFPEGWWDKKPSIKKMKNTQNNKKVKKKEVYDYNSLQRAILMMEIGEKNNFNFKDISGKIEKTIVLRRIG